MIHISSCKVEAGKDTGKVLGSYFWPLAIERALRKGTVTSKEINYDARQQHILDTNLGINLE